MSSPQPLRAIGNRASALEQRLMDLWDSGHSRERIIEITGEKPSTVDRVLGYMRDTEPEILARRSIPKGSAALLAAIARHHPERIRA
ncbi:hypothetical protein [Sphingobium sp. LSP13-1-1.1]|uniref:hypothetical protein n=1 Tax=Sphingobium sp. LSP13-1-1.1 TaxID=3135234 RepID=UPI0034121787